MTIQGVSGPAAGSLEGVSPFVFYYAGTTTSGTATTTAPSQVGTYTVQAVFLGSSDYLGASTQTTFTIASPTLTRVSASPTVAFFGQAVTLAATVTATAPGAAAPTGSVTFVDTTTNTPLGTVTLPGSNGQDVVTLATSSLPVGSQTITATYSSSTNSFAASSGTVVVSIGAAVYVLDPTASGAVNLSGNANVNVAGAVVVDSSSSTALIASGNAILTASAIDLVGRASTSGNATLSQPVTKLSSTVSDPLAGLTQPSAGNPSGAVNVSGNTSLTINPGTYPSITVSGNGKLTLNPGIYYLTSGGFNVSGNGIVKSVATSQASGVLIFNAGGAISISGSGQLNLTPQSSGMYAGMVFFQPSTNKSAITLSGNGIVGLNSGMIYAPAAALTISGSGNNGNAKHTPLIVDELNVSGNGISTDAQVDGPTSGDNSSSGSTADTSDGVAFITPAQFLPGGRPSPIMTVQLQDADGNPIAAGSGGVTLTLSSTSANGTFLDTNGVPLANPTITIPEGVSTASFEYEDTSVGFPILTAAAPGLSAHSRKRSGAGTTAYTPAQIRTAYGINNLSWTAPARPSPSSMPTTTRPSTRPLDTFDTQFGLTDAGPTLYGQYGPASSFLTVVNQNGKPPPCPAPIPAGAGTDNWEMEEALDVEWAHAIAPGASIVLVEANSQSLADLMTGVGHRRQPARRVGRVDELGLRRRPGGARPGRGALRPAT